MIKEEISNQVLKYFNYDPLAANVWIDKYALKNEKGEILESTPDDMHRRIAKEIARIESNYPNPLSEQDIYYVLKDFKYIIPQGSPMFGIGNNYQIVSLSNCFVIGDNNAADSYGSIMKTDQEQVQLMKRRAGVGHDLSHIRPKGSPVLNSALTSTGIVPFMERYSNSTKEVAQGGRRGALMLSISINHPDSEDFIDAKLKEGKITGANISVKCTDYFMECVKNDTDFIHSFPIDLDISLFEKEIEGLEYKKTIKVDGGFIRKTKAKELWTKIVYNAWKSAEPGILFWDTIIRESVPDCYAEEGYKTVSTNPCTTGDTLIAVADGRMNISIKQLADEGKDISVYCLDKNNNVVVRTMRNPRITGYNEQIYKITLDNGQTIRVTSNHKFKLSSGEYVEAKDLKDFDSLFIMNKVKSSYNKIIFNKKDQNKKYYFLNTTNNKKYKREHVLLFEQLNNCKINSGYAIHHIDNNGLNNSIDNLKIMSTSEHNKLHSIDKLGCKNVYHKMSDEFKFSFASHPKERNPNYSNITNEELFTHALNLTKILNRRFSKRDWVEYAEKNNTLRYLNNDFRGGLINISKKAAEQLNISYINVDPRLVKTLNSALDSGYNARIFNNEVVVEKTCEECGKIFEIAYFKREISFCSHKCSLQYINNNENIKLKRTESINKIFLNKSIETKKTQINIFNELKNKLKRDPFVKEWESECGFNKVPHRLNSKYSFKSFKDLKNNCNIMNHKVVNVKLDGFEDVYNGTVDEFHNFFVGEFKEIDESGDCKFVYINNLQCGEIPLCSKDSCRLLALNLYSYVENPFTPQAKFNFDLFRKHAAIAQRMMDDIVDLELEKIDSIIAKINADPEDINVKIVELNLWKEIRVKAKEGRRTGVGITAEGDMLAALGLIYGTDNANDFAIEVQKTLAVECYKSSIVMAKERGCFSVWDLDKENNNPFIKRILENLSPDYLLLYQKYGRRNIANLTIAPTGTVSLLTQTTSGIEPCFMPIYKRRKRTTDKSKNVFTDESGEMFEEFNVFHHKFITWLEANGYNYDEVKNYSMEQLNTLVEKSPYYKATANDVDWVSKVKMQGRIQKWVDHSISCTVNVPKETSEDVIDSIYKEAYNSGCKGVTIYREGSRSGILISGDTKSNQKFEYLDSIKRPEHLECDIYHKTVQKRDLTIVVGLLEGKPFEMFWFDRVNNYDFPLTIKKGTVTKVKSKTYKLTATVNNKTYEIPNIISLINENEQTQTRDYSLMLRHRINPLFIIQSIQSYATITSFEKVVERVLKMYVKDGQKTKDMCPNCSAKLVFQSGCPICPECGWTAC